MKKNYNLIYAAWVRKQSNGSHTPLSCDIQNLGVQKNLDLLFSDFIKMGYTQQNAPILSAFILS